jgi:hypothetical protein
VAVFRWIGVRWIARELTGAWRSMRYDLTRRADPSRQATEVLYPEYDAYRRPPRRWYAAVGLGAVVAGGVAAVYVAVAGGLGALLSPIASAVPGLGGGAAPAVRSTGTGAPAVQQQVPLSASRPARVPVRRAPGSTAPSRPAEVPAPAPAVSTPVPVPTPQSPSPTPDHSSSPSSSPSVTPSPSPTSPGGTVEQP